MDDWQDTEGQDRLSLSPMGWALAIVRSVLVAGTVYGLLVFLALVRLLETPFGKRPVSPFIVQAACRISLFILRLRLEVEGKPMRHRGAVVANHSSWLDIFVLNAAQRIYFVSKAEVGSWPGIGLVAKATGTVFIERRSSQAKKQQGQFEERLIAGDRLLFFPEGTSTDSRHVLPFKSTLFAAFFAPGLREILWIQPVSVVYIAPKGEEARFYGWWGDMFLAPHLLKTMGALRQGRVKLVFHEPVRVASVKDRKVLAKHCEAAVRSGFSGAQALPDDGTGTGNNA